MDCNRRNSLERTLTTRYDYIGKNIDEYPADLKAWVKNQDYQQTASKVSTYYATVGDGEFIAETFAGFVNGRQMSDKVIALYKKLGGPALPGV